MCWALCHGAPRARKTFAEQGVKFVTLKPMRNHNVLSKYTAPFPPGTLAVWRTCRVFSHKKKASITIFPNGMFPTWRIFTECSTGAEVSTVTSASGTWKTARTFPTCLMGAASSISPLPTGNPKKQKTCATCWQKRNTTETLTPGRNTWTWLSQWRESSGASVVHTGTSGENPKTQKHQKIQKPKKQNPLILSFLFFFIFQKKLNFSPSNIL